MEHYLCSVSFPEAIRHAGVHLGAISSHLMMRMVTTIRTTMMTMVMIIMVVMMVMMFMAAT